MMIEKQVIVQWYTPDEKLPPDGLLVVVTASGKLGQLTYEHALAIGEFFQGEGWRVDDRFDDFTIHAWCDLEEYKG